MTEPIHDYDPAQALDGPEAIAVFLADALDTGDAAYIAKAMGVVARAKGMTALAKETGLAREQLYRSFSNHTENDAGCDAGVGVDSTARPQLQ